MMRKDKIVYRITVEDLQTVAEDTLQRKLSDEEIKKVEDRIGDFIGWYDAIDLAFERIGILPSDEENEDD